MDVKNIYTHDLQIARSDPTTDTVNLIKGKREVVTESSLPNILFAYGTEEQLKSFVLTT